MLSFPSWSFIAVLSLEAVLVKGAPSPVEIRAPRHHLPEADITWIGPAERGGKNYTFTGTHHEVTAQIKELNPYWMREGLAQRWIEEALKKRDPISNVQCNNGRAQGSSSAFEAGWQYINVHYGDGTCSAGAGACGRFACSYDSATLMCNDGSAPATIPCHTLANEAQSIWSICSNNGQYSAMEGQQFFNKPTQNTLLQHTDPGNGC